MHILGIQNIDWSNVFRILIFAGVLVCLYFLSGINRVTRRSWKRRMMIPEYLNQMAKIKSIDYAPSAIITINSVGTVISWNKGAESIFGYTEDEMLTKPLTIIIPERYRTSHSNALERTKHTGTGNLIGKTTRLEALRKNGNEFPIKLTLWQWKDGPNTYFTGIVRDISEDVILTERDTALLNMYKEGENIGEYGVYCWEILKDKVTYSEGFKQIFNLDKNQSDSVNMLKHVYYEDKHVVDEALKKLFETKKGYEIKYRIVDISGRIKNITSKTKAYLDNTGELQTLVGIIQENGN